MSDCPPQRQDYDNVKDFFKAIQKCNEENAKRNAIQVSEKPEGCNNELIQDKDEHDAGDILLKFILENGTNHCMYYSEFKKYIQNICNLYTEWTCMDESLCKGSDVGRGYTPILQAFDLLGILKFTNHCCVIDPLYWQVPIFSKGFLTMKTILEIQQKIEDAGTKSEIKVEINIKEDRKSGETFRTGNIYGTFGIGQSHAQKEDTLFYVLTESSDASEECSIKPDKGLFNFEGMATKLSLQLEIKDAVNYLYQNPMDLTKEPWNEFFLTDNKFNEQDLCPDTETVIDIFFSYYNNEILLVEAKNISSDGARAMKKIELSMTLEEMRKIIKDNQKIVISLLHDKTVQISDESLNISSSSYDSGDYMRGEESSPPIHSSNAYTPAPQSPGARVLFTGSPMSPNSRTPLNESTRSTEYDFVLSPERIGVSRSPISPIMQRLTMSDLESSHGRNLFGHDGGKNTFNRKKKPRKTKKIKRTKKYNKKIRRKISIKK